MMAEVVHHGHPAADSPHLHSPFDAFERVEGRLNLRVFQAAMFGAANHRQRVPDIQFTEKIEPELEAWNFELRRRRCQIHVECANRVRFSKAKSLYRAMSHVQQGSDVWIIAIRQ